MSMSKFAVLLKGAHKLGATIYIDHSEKGMPMKPNSGDIIWYPSASTGKPA